MTVPPRRPMFYDPDGNPIDMWGFERLWGDPAVRFVAQEHVGPYFVSTVWLGVDYNFTGIGPPLIFESMVFHRAQDDGPDMDRMAMDEDTTRYPTREAALEGHRELVALVRAELDVTSAEDHVGDDPLVAEALPLTPEQRRRLLEPWLRSRRCLVCGSAPATHRFAVLGGPDEWLCEDHKDDAVTVDGVTYGRQERRADDR